MDAVMSYFRRDALAAHLGMELLEVSPGRAAAKMLIRDFHLNSYGMVHGAAIFALADYVFQAASNSHGTLAVAMHVDITYVRPGGQGALAAEAAEVNLGRTTGIYSVTVRTEEGKTVAIFQGMVYRKGTPLPIEDKCPHPPGPH
jgi:acyl-CoA thioesterase